MASPNPNQNYDCTLPSPSAPIEDWPLIIPGAVLHLIDKDDSVELATGDLVVHCLGNGNETLAVLASVSDEIQWPLTKDVATVKLDDSHYFFSFTPPKEAKPNAEAPENDVLSYGLTIASRGQESLLRQLDGVLERCSSFTVQKVDEKAGAEVLEGGLSPERCAAYWTTLAPNVEEYSGTAAKYIASGSGQLIKGILWCGDVTSDRLNWGNEALRKRMAPGGKAQISPEALQRIQRVKSVSKMTEKVALGVLSGAVRVSGYFTSSIVNSRVGKKFFGLLPGEVLLASLDGFSKICDAVEVAGKNVMSTSSTVTTGLVDHRYGEEAAKATSEGLDAAGHAVGTAWTVLKLRQALNPKSVLKPTALTKAVAAAEKQTKGSK